MTTPVLEPDKVRTIIEAILVTADVPVTPGKLVSLFDGLGIAIDLVIHALDDGLPIYALHFGPDAESFRRLDGLHVVGGMDQHL